MAPRVEAVVALDPYVARGFFADGEVRDVDMAPLLAGPIFPAVARSEPLRAGDG